MHIPARLMEYGYVPGEMDFSIPSGSGVLIIAPENEFSKTRMGE